MQFIIYHLSIIMQFEIQNFDQLKLVTH